MNFIDMLYEGNILPFENFEPATEEYLKESEALVKYEEKLYSILSEEALEFFKSYQTFSDNTNYILNRESFRQGFRSGAQMMMEVLKEDKVN